MHHPRSDTGCLDFGIKVILRYIQSECEDPHKLSTKLQNSGTIFDIRFLEAGKRTLIRPLVISVQIIRIGAKSGTWGFLKV